MRAPETQCWLFGVLLAPGVDLPPFPELKPEDLDVLQPLPGDDTVMPEGPFRGYKFVDIATNFESEPYCKQVMHIALNLEPMSPPVFRLASYLYVRLQIAWQAGVKLSGTGQVLPAGKRPFSPEDMLTSRTIKVPLQLDYYDPSSLKVHECEVMMVDEDLNYEAYAVQPADPPGLAIYWTLGATAPCTAKNGPKPMKRSSLNLDFNLQSETRPSCSRGLEDMLSPRSSRPTLLDLVESMASSTQQKHQEKHQC